MDVLNTFHMIREMIFNKLSANRILPCQHCTLSDARHHRELWKLPTFAHHTVNKANSPLETLPNNGTNVHHGNDSSKHLLVRESCRLQNMLHTLSDMGARGLPPPPPHPSPRLARPSYYLALTKQTRPCITANRNLGNHAALAYPNVTKRPCSRPHHSSPLRA